LRRRARVGRVDIGGRDAVTASTSAFPYVRTVDHGQCP
jgi:hypothetical protein